MIRHRAKFSSTEFNYALDVNSFTLKGSQGEIKALWFKKNGGHWTIYEGTLSSYSYRRKAQGPITDLGSFMENYGGEGGNTEFKWDGISMWSNDYQNRFIPQMDAYNRLNPILEEFIKSFETSKKPGSAIKNNPNVPAGYTGWFAVKEKR